MVPVSAIIVLAQLCCSGKNQNSQYYLWKMLPLLQHHDFATLVKTQEAIIVGMNLHHLFCLIGILSIVCKNKILLSSYYNSIVYKLKIASVKSPLVQFSLKSALTSLRSTVPYGILWLLLHVPKIQYPFGMPSSPLTSVLSSRRRCHMLPLFCSVFNSPDSNNFSHTLTSEQLTSTSSPQLVPYDLDSWSVSQHSVPSLTTTLGLCFY